MNRSRSGTPEEQIIRNVAQPPAPRRLRQAPRLAPMRRGRAVAQDVERPPTPSIEERRREAPATRSAGSKKSPPKMKKGGMVKKTGMVILHKGEVVIPAHRVASVDKALKKSGMKPLKK